MSPAPEADVLRLFLRRVPNASFDRGLTAKRRPIYNMVSMPRKKNIEKKTGEIGGS